MTEAEEVGWRAWLAGDSAGAPTGTCQPGTMTVWRGTVTGWPPLAAPSMSPRARFLFLDVEGDLPGGCTRRTPTCPALPPALPPGDCACAGEPAAVALA